MIPRIQISFLVPNFCFNSQFWSFWPDLLKKDFFGLKQKKQTPHIFYIILHIQISLMRNFNSNWQFWYFGLNSPKNVFSVSEHHHGILHIWICLGTKFQFKLIILSFWPKFTQKWYFKLKSEQAVEELQAFAFGVVKVNSAVVFKHFEDLKDLISWTFWKKNWLCLAFWALFILKLYKTFQTALCK